MDQEQRFALETGVRERNALPACLSLQGSCFTNPKVDILLNFFQIPVHSQYFSVFAQNSLLEAARADSQSLVVGCI
jgi:hypothetical protein